MIDVPITVKGCRKFRRMTVNDLARISGVTRQSIYRIESGSNCSADTLQLLLDAMGFELELAVKKDNKEEWRLP